MPEQNGEQRKIRLEVKNTRAGKLLTFADEEREAGDMAMTDAERKAHDYIENLVTRFDEEAAPVGTVGYVIMTRSSEPVVEWCSEEARIAAGGAA